MAIILALLFNRERAPLLSIGFFYLCYRLLKNILFGESFGYAWFCLMLLPGPWVFFCFAIIVSALLGRIFFLALLFLGLCWEPAYNISTKSSFWAIPLSPTSALYNGLFFIHPIFLYVAGSLIFFICCQYASSKLASIHNQSSLRLATTALWCSVFALILGGVWAQMELNWGGWWSWDLVELASLNIMFVSILCVHLNRAPLLQTRYVTLVSICVLVIGLGLRLGLFQSVHNFVSPENAYNFFLKCWLLLLLIFFKWRLNKSQHLLLFCGFIILVFFLSCFLYDSLLQTPFLNTKTNYANNVVIIIFCGLFICTGARPTVVFIGWAPLAITFLNLKWLKVIESLFFHIILFLTVITMTLTRFYVGQTALSTDVLTAGYAVAQTHLHYLSNSLAQYYCKGFNTSLLMLNETFGLSWHPTSLGSVLKSIFIFNTFLFMCALKSYLVFVTAKVMLLIFSITLLPIILLTKSSAQQKVQVD